MLLTLVDHLPEPAIAPRTLLRERRHPCGLYIRKVKGFKYQLRWWLQTYGSVNCGLYDEESAQLVRTRLVKETVHYPPTPLGMWKAALRGPRRAPPAIPRAGLARGPAHLGPPPLTGRIRRPRQARRHHDPDAGPVPNSRRGAPIARQSPRRTPKLLRRPQAALLHVARPGGPTSARSMNGAAKYHEPPVANSTASRASCQRIVTTSSSEIESRYSATRWP